MRAVLILAAVAVLPAPAFAQAPAPQGGVDRADQSRADSADTRDSGEFAREMNDPVRQAEMAAAVEGMAGVVLDMPAAPFLRAAARMAGQDPAAVDNDARIGDLAGPEAAEAPREMARRLPQMMGAMSEMAVALEDMLPRLAEAGARVQERAEGNRR